MKLRYNYRLELKFFPEGFWLWKKNVFYWCIVQRFATEDTPKRFGNGKIVDRFEGSDKGKGFAEASLIKYNLTILE